MFWTDLPEDTQVVWVGAPYFCYQTADGRDIGWEQDKEDPKSRYKEKEMRHAMAARTGHTEHCCLNDELNGPWCAEFKARFRPE